MAALVTRGLRTICFAKSRKSAELIHKFTRDRVDAETASRLAPYRAGYTPAQRREIERRLVGGDLLGVAATDALELGIDIGLLDCAISVGFPGTVASLRQQWGRYVNGVWHRRARARILHRPRGRDLPPPRRELPRPRARSHRTRGRRDAVQRRLLHAGKEGDSHRDRASAAHRASLRPRAHLRPHLRDRTGGRVSEEVDSRPVHARDGAARSAGDELRDRGGLVPADGRPAGRARADAEAPLE